MTTPVNAPSPPICVEYSKKGERVTKLFTDPFKARAFYIKKSKEGANPKAIKPSKEG